MIYVVRREFIEVKNFSFHFWFSISLIELSVSMEMYNFTASSWRWITLGKKLKINISFNDNVEDLINFCSTLTDRRKKIIFRKKSKVFLPTRSSRKNFTIFELRSEGPKKCLLIWSAPSIMLWVYIFVLIYFH